MSEFANSYFNQSEQQNSYNEAVAEATGATQANQAKYNRELAKYNLEQQKEEKKEGAVQAITGVVGGGVFTEGLRDIVSNAGKKVAKKVVDTATEKLGNAVNEIADRATTATKNLVSNATDSIVSKAKSASSVSRDLTKLPDADISGAENLVKRNALKNLQSRTTRQFGKFDPASQADSATSDLSTQALENTRNITSSGGRVAMTLDGTDVDDLNPTSFFQQAKGFDAGGELTRGKVGNPYSITDPANQDALQGAKDFKQFGSRAEQLSDMRMGDQLQPLRDLNNMTGRGDMKPSQVKSYNQVKAEVRAKAKIPESDPDADLKAKLPDLTDEGGLTPRVAPPQPVQQGSGSPAQPAQTADSLAEDTTTEADAVEAVPKSIVSNGVSETSFGGAPLEETGAKAGAEAGAETGAEIGGDVLAGAEAGADVGAIAEGGLNPIADVAAIGLGLAGVLGGIFGKKKPAPPPTPPPPAPLLNPSVALGI
jgi:hypothetical protein